MWLEIEGNSSEHNMGWCRMAKPLSLPRFPLHVTILLTATFLVFSIVSFSFPGKIPTPFTTSYSATKFALDGFFSSLRHELIMQNRNVSVTLCILGLIDTDTALENTRCVFGGGRRSLGGSVSAGTCLFLKACKKCTTVFKMVCASVWMCKKTNGKSASAWVHHGGCACTPQHRTWACRNLW